MNDDLHGDAAANSANPAHTPDAAGTPPAHEPAPEPERVEPRLQSAATPAAPAAAAAPAAPAAPAASAAAAVTSRRRPFWQWWLIASLVVSAVALVCLVTAIGHFDDAPLHVIVDGQEVGKGVDITFGALSTAHQVALVSGLVLAVVVVMLVVPLALAIALLVTVVALAIGLVAGIGVPLVTVGAVLVLVSSPVWIPVLLIVWVVRANRRAAAAAAAAMAAAERSSSATIRA